MRHSFLALALLTAGLLQAASTTKESLYLDQRPETALRLMAEDQGVVMTHSDGPDRCDSLGAREAVVFEDQGTYYLHYDGAGPRGWIACLATSRDLVHWRKHGPILDFGAPGTLDSASAASPWVIQEQGVWHMFYVGTPNATKSINRIPLFPYLTMKARSAGPAGPWEKQYGCVPFRTQPNTYYAATASPGCVIKHQGDYLMFFSGSVEKPKILRTLGLATTRDLNGSWTVSESPIVPLEEQVENSSIYYEEANDTWFLFTNHIGLNHKNQEYPDAIWVYWSHDPKHWDAAHKAVVLDGSNCSWAKATIGMPSVIRVGDRLALLYDGAAGTSLNSMEHNIGLAWLKLPLIPPMETGGR